MSPSLSLTQPAGPAPLEKAALTAVALGLLALLAAAFDADAGRGRLSMYAALALVSGGTLALTSSQ